MGQGIWQHSFQLRKWETGLLAGILIVLYLAQVHPFVPLGFLKLAALVVLVVIPLRLVHIASGEPSSLRMLDGSIQAVQLAPLLLIPITATLVYALAEAFPPSDDLLRGIFISIYSIQALAGAGFFIWAWADSIKTHREFRAGG